jgi:hypothetical protein
MLPSEEIDGHLMGFGASNPVQMGHGVRRQTVLDVMFFEVVMVKARYTCMV